MSELVTVEVAGGRLPAEAGLGNGDGNAAGLRVAVAGGRGMNTAHGDGASGEICPTCQGNGNMRREIEEEADAQARKQFRLFVVLYLVYPAVILGLLGVIAAGLVFYLKGATQTARNDYRPYPVFCDPTGASGYMPASAPPRGGGYQPAIPSGGGFAPPSITLPPVGIPSINPGIQAAGASARERIAYYVYVSIRAADGEQDARYERNMISLSQYEIGLAHQHFAERSRKDGKLGFLRLGITQLGADAFNVAETGKLTVPFCPPNDFATTDKRQAYVNFAVASYCDKAGATRANDWLETLAKFEDFTDEEMNSLQAEAASFLPQACFAQLAAEPPPEPTDDSPGEPYAQPSVNEPNIPQSREQAAAARARQLLGLGDAALAVGRLDRARGFWLQSIDAGRAVGAQASITAQKRIQTRTLTCHFDAQSVAAISRDYEERSGDLIHLRVIQEALHALGHYDGPINGSLSVVTRAAIRKFQREMAFDETDTLTPLQTVYVICNAAETARDLSSTNALGIMYVTGLGVTRNVDLALEWLRSASARQYSEATFNLALIYGTGIVLHSYRLCDIPRNLEQADQYLREAAKQNHPLAAEMWSNHVGKEPAKRWIAIEDELSKRYDKRGVFKKTKEALKPLPPPQPGDTNGARCEQDGGADKSPVSTY